MKPQTNKTVRTRIAIWLYKIPTDVGLIVCYTLLAASLLVLVEATPIRLLVGLPLLFFLPGYAILTVLFPRSSEPAMQLHVNTYNSGDGRIDLSERFALSFGVSTGLLPLIGVLYSTIGVFPTEKVVVSTLVSFTLVGMIVGAFRRHRVPKDDRFSLPITSWQDTIATELTVDSRSLQVTNMALALVVVVGLSSLTFALVAPMPGDTYSSLSLQTMNESGEPVAGDYPTNLTVGESASLVVTVENQEHKHINYTMVVQQHVTSDNNDTINDTYILDEFTIGLDNGERKQWTHEFTPSARGENIRLTYLLYRGESPTNPTVENAYRSSYLWVEVVQE